MSRPIRYAEEEVRSFLPAGWELAPGQAAPDGTLGRWDPEKRAWKVRVVDNVKFDWPVVVKADDLAGPGLEGRIAALKRAMDKVFRERLG